MLGRPALRGQLKPPRQDLCRFLSGRVVRVYNQKGMGSEVPPCGVCGQSVESVEILNQYGGACPYCLGFLTPEESPAAAPTRPPPTGGEFGKYVLTDRLGKGGMGEVWKAIDTELRRSVALKFLHSEDPLELSRFEREAHLAASLSHANIGAIHEIGEIDGRHYLAMQYVPGQTLEKYPKDDRRLMARLIRDASRAVDHAHRNGVLHRDIKPANLMVEEVDDGCRVVVLDFGIARAIEGGEKLSMTGDVVGTATYMSPEQAKGGQLDERADVYSLGATLYEVLTGKNPFDGANVYEVLANVVAEEPIAPRRLDPRIPHDLETIVLKCLEKDRERRYASAKDLADDLDRFLEGEAIHAKRANTIYRLRMKLAKRKAVVATAGIAATLLAVLLGWWLLVGRPHSDYLKFMADGRKLWEEARVAAITGVEPEVIRKMARAVREHFEAAIRAQSDAVGHLMRGRCLALEGDEKGALAALEKALELDSGNADARVELARSLLLNYVASRGTPWTATYDGKVTPDFGALASERPQERQWRERAERLLAQGETASTQQGLLKGLIAMGQGKWDVAAKELAVYTKAERWDAQALMLAAVCAYYVKEYDGAVAALDRSLNLVPRSEGFRWRGLAKQAKGLQDEAIADYTKAIELDPKYARAYMNRGFVKYAKNLLDDTIADFTKAVELDPKSAPARVNLGNGKLAKGQHDEAIANYTKAIELDPTYMPAYYNRGTVRQAKGFLDDAIEDFTKAIELDSKSAGSYLNRGFAKASKGLLDEAILDYSKAIELDPKYARAFANRGLAKQAKGLVDEAILDLEKALEVAPPGWPQRAEIQERIKTAGAPRLFEEASRLHQQKRYPEAIEKFKIIAESHPKTQAGIHSAYNIACGYALLGENSKALDWLEKAADMGFTNFGEIERDADLKSLHGEERFRRLVEKLKTQ